MHNLCQSSAGNSNCINFACIIGISNIMHGICFLNSDNDKSVEVYKIDDFVSSFIIFSIDRYNCSSFFGYKVFTSHFESAKASRTIFCIEGFSPDPGIIIKISI